VPASGAPGGSAKPNLSDDGDRCAEDSGALAKAMADASPRTVLFLQVCVAHFVGLAVTGLFGSIGTTAGFGSGAGAAIFVGGILSLPWFFVLSLVIWFAGSWLAQHQLVLPLVGPMAVCASYFVLLGRTFLDAVAVSCVASSIFLLGCIAGRHVTKRFWPNAR